MKTTSQKLSLDDLSIGMSITSSQLSEILDTYIILKDVHLVKNGLGIGTFEGIVDAISKTEIRLTKPNSTLIYNDSFERKNYCEYE